MHLDVLFLFQSLRKLKRNCRKLAWVWCRKGVPSKMACQAQCPTNKWHPSCVQFVSVVMTQSPGFAAVQKNRSNTSQQEPGFGMSTHWRGSPDVSKLAKCCKCHGAPSLDIDRNASVTAGPDHRAKIFESTTLGHFNFSYSKNPTARQWGRTRNYQLASTQSSPGSKRSQDLAGSDPFLVAQAAARPRLPAKSHPENNQTINQTNKKQTQAHKNTTNLC